MTREEKEALQASLITYLDEYPEDLIDALCQCVVDYKEENEV